MKVNESFFGVHSLIEIDNFLTSKQCDEITKRIESKKIEPNTDQEFELQRQYRVKFDSESIKMIMDSQLEKFQLKFSKLMESFSYVRYENDGYIPSHLDNLKGEHVILIYLNDKYTNGETYLISGHNLKTIEKKKGKAFIFDGSKIVHGCFKVTGTKRIIIGKLVS